MTSALAARARDLALMLTRLPSVTGSPAEAALPAQLAAALNFPRVWTIPIQGDPAARHNLFALKPGPSRRTVVLTGHFDVVSVEDYGPLQTLAFDPTALLPALIHRLHQTGENPSALADLESGTFLPGRGLLDMKAGLAAGIAAMEAYTGDLTLIFLAVADEEEKSAGARAAIPQLRQLAADEGLDIALVINLDAIADTGDGTQGRVVTYGSIGKLLLTALVVGQQTHAGYPQNGVNAAYVLSELVTELDLNPALSETTGTEVAAPPATLCARDLKQGYNVTTPHLAFGTWNTMQHRRSGADVLDTAMALATRAVARAAARTGHPIALKRISDLPPTPFTPDPTLSLPDQTLQALTALAQTIDTPTVLLGFAAIPYPAVLLPDGPLRQAISKAVRQHGLGEVNYFAGISDVSFFGQPAGDLTTVASNTPIWGHSFTMPDPGGFPAINIGPWGRDYHTWLERLHAPYAFDTLPRVLLSVIDAVANLPDAAP